MLRPPLFWATILVAANFLHADTSVLPGVVLEIRGKASKSIDYRLERRVALRVDKNEPPSAFVDVGPFEAVWHGVILLEKRERINFAFEGFGKASLLLDGEKVLETEGEDLSTVESERLRLNGGEHPFELRYSSTASGMARFRLFWKGRDFAKESIAAKSLAHFPTGKTAGFQKKSSLLRQGRFLFASHGCVRCHLPDEPFNQKTAMPEALAMGPSLVGVGSRLRKVWLEKWILDPQSIRHNARMPKMVNSRTEASHLVAFLSSLKNENTEKNIVPGDSKSGGVLLADLGCISCHTLSENDTIDENGRISLVGVGRKYLPGRLATFLIEPDKHYPWIRMPNFRLSRGEAANLAAFLQDLESPAPNITTSIGDAGKGKLLASSRGCAACHELPCENKLITTSLSKLSVLTGAGCLVESSKGPRFSFSKEERSAITVFLEEKDGSLERHSPPEFANRQFEELRCVACHERDGKESLWESFSNEVSSFRAKEIDILDVASNPEQAHLANRSPPDLSFAGEKLTENWLASFLAGKVAEKPRPWMKARMPNFSIRAKYLASGLSGSCGVFPEMQDEPRLHIEKQLEQVGGKIVSTLCITCHGVGDQKPTAVFEGQGVNLSLARSRMRREHYMRWMMNPYRITPNTIMPRFADDEGRTGLIDLFEGDARRQFVSVWHYLRGLSN
jgi:cytochrome c553